MLFCSGSRLGGVDVRLGSLVSTAGWPGCGPSPTKNFPVDLDPSVSCSRSPCRLKPSTVARESCGSTLDDLAGSCSLASSELPVPVSSSFVDSFGDMGLRGGFVWRVVIIEVSLSGSGDAFMVVELPGCSSPILGASVGIAAISYLGPIELLESFAITVVELSPISIEACNSPGVKLESRTSITFSAETCCVGAAHSYLLGQHWSPLSIIGTQPSQGGRHSCTAQTISPLIQ